MWEYRFGSSKRKLWKFSNFPRNIYVIAKIIVAEIGGNDYAKKEEKNSTQVANMETQR